MVASGKDHYIPDQLNKAGNDVNLQFDKVSKESKFMESEVGEAQNS